MRFAPRLVPPILSLLLVLAAACSGDHRRGAGDGGPIPEDAGTTRDAARDDDAGGPVCGGATCAAGEVCCTDCDGTQSCGMACPGHACLDAGPGGCRTDADCPSSGEYCRAPDAPTPCGIGCMYMRDCEAATDCASGEVCAEYLGACCFSGDPLSSQCQPACTEGSCADGMRCGTDGICEPIPCDEGYTCPAHTVCTGTGPHGCARDTCASDTDCGGGVCVLGRCYSELGVCQGPVP